MDRPIPALYCCYLLRSKVYRGALYVGSTPNPHRRLNQHNGVVTGGAQRTKSDKLRPWEMVCLVSGFPSKIAALQFEWSWQNPDVTRHIPASERLTEIRWGVTRHGKRKRIKPRLSLSGNLSNLHLLLRVKSFERWPLNVRFRNEDVWKAWTRCADNARGTIRKDINVALELHKGTHGSPTGIEPLDVTYMPMREQLKRSRDVFAGILRHECCICHEEVKPKKDHLLMCASKSCMAISHLKCLSEALLQQEGDSDAILPTVGCCPACQTKLQWVDLAKDLSLRTRGQEIIKAILERQEKPADSKDPAAMTEAERAAAERLLGGLEDEDDEAVEDGPGLIKPRRKSAVEAAIEENRHMFDSDEDVETIGAAEATNLIDHDDSNGSTKLGVRQDPKEPRRRQKGARIKPTK